MILCPEHEVVFLAVPRTASRAMRDALLVSDITTSQVLPHHETAIPAHAREWTALYCVRNPYARAYSQYQHAIREGWTDREACNWLRLDHARETVAWQTRIADGAHRAIKFEELPGAWAAATLGLLGTRLPLPFVNDGTALGEGWRTAYDRATADEVWARTAHDFTLHGYERGSWKQ